MKLTPLDIKKQEFTRSFRGVDAQEVQSFLHMLADQWDSLLDENRRLEQKLRELDSKLEHYRKIEEALQEALETARDNSHKTIENAQREAQIILKEARGAAEEMRKKTSTDHKRLKQDITKISSRRDEVIARLRAFLMSEMELLARFEGQDPIGFVRLETGDTRQLSEPDYYGNRSSGREVHVDSSYDRSDRNAYEPNEPSVNLPMDEEEVSFEEDGGDADPYYRSNKSPAETRETPFDFSTAAQREEAPSSGSEGLSTDELEFIKSTVTSATKKVSADDIFKPARPEAERPWSNGNGHVNTSSGMGSTPPRQTEYRPSTPSEPLPPRGQPGHSDAGWIVRPPVTGRNENTPPPANKPRSGGFASSLFGAENDSDDLSATPEEIEKIRRILNDLD